MVLMKNQMEVIHKYKVVILGDASVGKTNIVAKFMYQKFGTDYQPTIGIDFLSKTICLEDKSIRLQMWDTAGQERFRNLIPSYIKDSSVALIVYDVTNRQSFLNAEKLIEQVRNLCGKDVIIVLVGNKSDLVEIRQVSIQAGDAKARALGTMFIETSAKDGSDIKHLFNKIVAQLLEMNTLSSTKQKEKVLVNLESSSKTSQLDQSEAAELQEAKRRKNSARLAQLAKDDEGNIESLKKGVTNGLETLKKRLEEEKSARMLAEELLELTKIKAAELAEDLQAAMEEKKKLHAALHAIVSGDSRSLQGLCGGPEQSGWPQCCSGSDPSRTVPRSPDTENPAEPTI